MKCVTVAQAVRLDSLGIGIQNLVQLRDYNSQEGFLTALREKEIRDRNYSHTLRKTSLASTDVAVVSETPHYTQFPLPNLTITSTLLLHEHTTERFTNDCYISLLKNA